MNKREIQSIVYILAAIGLIAISWICLPLAVLVAFCYHAGLAAAILFLTSAIAFSSGIIILISED